MGHDENMAEFVHRLVEGRSSAVRDVYDRYFERICVVFGNRRGRALAGRLGASDLAQSVLVAFLGRAEQFLAEASDDDVIWRLICGIALNKLRERRREAFRAKRDARRDHSFADDAQNLEWLESAEPAPFELVELAESLEVIASHLNDFDRRVLGRLAIGESAGEIADHLNCSYWKINRAVGRIRLVAARIWKESLILKELSAKTSETGS